MVTMEHIAFIHGSSEGKSTVIPSGSLSSICNDISDKYFKGRTLRQKSSAAKLSLFVDLYKDLSGNRYCVYSFVNNECYAKNGRDGQYLSISIICKEYYVFPEEVYRMLHAAYKQMYDTGRIIRQNNEKNDQYVIAQFSDQEEYLLKLLQKIDETFSSFASQHYTAIRTNNVSADYDSWRGTKTNTDNCNSISVYSEFCKIGRIFVSDEYESQSEVIKTLEVKIQNLEKENNELANRISEQNTEEKIKKHTEINELNTQLQQKDKQIVELTEDNNKYQAVIGVVREELDKVKKVSNSIVNAKATISQYEKCNKKDIIKYALLILIFIFTLISAILNYIFFRDSSSFNNNKKDEQASEQPVDNTGDTENYSDSVAFEFEITPSKLDINSDGGTLSIEVICNSKWDVPDFYGVDWVHITKQDNKHLSVQVDENADSSERECTFMVYDKQVKISQAGQKAFGVSDYGISVIDSNGNKLSNYSTVPAGETLKAQVKGHKNESKYGWKYHKCEGDINNLKDVTIKITGQPGETAIISYGDLNDSYARQRFRLRIVNKD